MRKFFFILCAICLSFSGYCQSILSKTQALEDFDWLAFSLDHVHPRLYKYESKDIVQSRFDSVRNVLSSKDSIPALDFLSLVSKLNSKVNCGHLYTIPQGGLKDVVLKKKVLPFQVKILHNKLFVLHDIGKGKRIPNGSEVISINGKPTREIIQSIKEGIATDGWIETRKDRLIERYFFESFHGFDLYYYLHVDRSRIFKIRYKKFDSQKEVTITKEGISAEQRNKLLKEVHGVDVRRWFKNPSPVYEINEEKNLAVLTISRSFYNETIDPVYDSVLSILFKKLEEKNIKNLVVDLRENEGGSENHQAGLIKYLYNKPHKLYDNIFFSRLDFRALTPIIHSEEMGTSDLWYNNQDQAYRKINDNLWVNNKPNIEGLQFQPPAEHQFKGQLYVLMSGISFSSTSSLIANIKNTTNAILIGEESGGMYEGPTGGMEIPIILPNSQIMVRISPNIQWSYMYKNHPIGRGVLPDHPIIYAIEDVVDGRDLEMQKALQLIKSK